MQKPGNSKQGAVFVGGCHCGAVRIAFRTENPLNPRACQCSFCRKHAARTVSDPAGSASILVRGALPKSGYRFASRSGWYIVCDSCGVYAGVWSLIGGQRYAALNLNAFDDPKLRLAATPVCYDGQTAEAMTRRRAALWTPCLGLIRAAHQLIAGHS